MRPMLLVIAFALVFAAGGCGEDPIPGLLTDVVIVRPDGSSPLAGHDTVTIRVQQGEAPIEEIVGAVSDSGFDLSVELADELVEVSLSVELSGPSSVLVGAPPPFLPLETGGFVQIVVGEPDSCGVVAALSLPSARARPGVTPHGTFGLVVGGEDADGPSAFAGFIDLLQLDAGAFEDLPTPIGAATAVAFNRAQAVVLGDVGEPFVYDIRSAERPTQTIALHAGAGAGSSALSLGEEGAVVVGGGATGAAVDGVSWIGTEGAVATTRLAVARARPALVQLGARVLVIGGVAPGEPWAEAIARSMAAGMPLDAFDDGVRDGGHAFASADGTSALLVGGVDATGAPRSDTVLLTGCPSCVAAAGPDWAGARGGPASTALPGGGGLLLGGDPPGVGADRVSFDPPRIETVGPLDNARSDASLLALQSGVVFVLGGRGPGGPRADVEVCFPTVLATP